MDKVELDVHVDIFSAHIVCDLCDEDATFFLRPAKDLADEAEGVRLDAHGHVLALVAADFFHARILRPRANGYLAGVSDSVLDRGVYKVICLP